MTEMTDSGLETLVAKYEAGAASDENENELEWLNARSAIEAQKDQLTPEQVKRVKKADLTLLRNIDRVQERVTETLSLADQRAAAPHPAEEWWWYLDVLEPLRDDYKLPKPPRPVEQIFSTLFFVLEIVLLAVAAFVLARNLTLIPTPVAPTSTTAPTGTPAPTETLNPVAFDMSKATLYKSNNDIFEVQLPGGWTTQPGTSDKQVSLNYGAAGSESITMQIILGTSAEIYTQALQVTTAPDSPKAALEAFKAQLSANRPDLKWSDVTPKKVGALDGQGLSVIVSGEQAAQVEFRLAPASDGELVFVFFQARESLWSTAQPVIYKMLDSLVVKPQNVPTATPTATLHPLLMTATAVQKEIIALTPTNTPTTTPTPTAAGTDQATKAATTGFPATSTPAATAPSTVEAPAAATATVPAPTATKAATATVPAPTATSTATSTAEATAAATAGK
jgi:hypothetical protein